jgi:hypothetical protein
MWASHFVTALLIYLFSVMGMACFVGAFGDRLNSHLDLVVMFAVPAILPVALFRRWRRQEAQFRTEQLRLARSVTGYCPVCGYDLRGGHENCPECGASAPKPAP